MIVQQKDYNKGYENEKEKEQNKNKNKNNKNKKDKKRTLRQEEQNTNDTTNQSSPSNKRHKNSSSNNTFKDDTNESHLYDHTYTLINDENILKIGTHNVQSFHNKVKQQQILNTVENLKIDIFGLSETNLTDKHIKHVARSLDKSYDYFFSAGDRKL